jgi:hypothetical protein
MNKPETFIVTSSNNSFDFASAHFCKPELDEIVSALNRICRYNSHTSRMYSVLEHSLVCLEIYFAACRSGIYSYSNKDALSVLTHDFHEAYIGDISSPVRKMLDFISENRTGRALRELEDYVDERICDALNIPHQRESQIVYEVDMHALHLEHCWFFGESKHSWSYPVSSKLVLMTNKSKIQLDLFSSDNPWTPDCKIVKAAKELFYFLRDNLENPNNPFDECDRILQSYMEVLRND